MATSCCRIVRDFTGVKRSQEVRGITSVSINPPSSPEQNTGTVVIGSYGFNASTGPYLGLTCGVFKIQGTINWQPHLKCAINDSFPIVRIPGNNNIADADSMVALIPQIQAPVVIETTDTSVPSINGYTLILDSGDKLNQDPVITMQADGTSGPQATYTKNNTFFYRYVNFEGLDPLFTFNTKTGKLDTPVDVTIDGDDYKLYPQSFELTVEPPRPAMLNFTYVYKFIDMGLGEITNCD